MDLNTVNRYLAACHLTEQAAKKGCVIMWRACWQVAAEKWDQMNEVERALARSVKESS